MSDEENLDGEVDTESEFNFMGLGRDNALFFEGNYSDEFLEDEDDGDTGSSAYTDLNTDEYTNSEPDEETSEENNSNEEDQEENELGVDELD